MMKQPAIFLDRDGTLVEEVNYLHRVEDLRFFPFTETAVRRFKDAGFLVIVVTNQSGIGRGVYTEDDMHSLHNEIQRRLDGAIDGFYFCPHLPDAGCACRKPRLGMIEQALAIHDIDMKGSWMIGDKNIDVETAINAGISSGMVRTGYGRKHEAILWTQPDVIEDDLGAVSERVVEMPA
jgi:D-glycero-D-manno-heptose 1,7-bisphosphate phosphatase